MAGRGRAATLPAWMTAPPGGGAGAPPGPPGPPTAGAPAPTAGARGKWTEHRAADGRLYWNDGSSSTYSKPKELMTPMERADASTRWKEHRAPDGRVYYYHQDTRETRWSLPDDLRMAREAAALAQSAIAAAAAARSAPKQTANAAAGADGNATGSPAGTGTDAPSLSKRAPRAPRDPNAPPRVYADKDERKTAFKELLEDFEVTSRHKWDETAKQIKADERFDALKTLGEKKQCFNEYQTQRAKHEREQKRLAEKATRNEFTTMLHERWREWGVEDPSTARHRPTLRDHVDVILASGDSRFTNVKDWRDQDDLFRAFCDDLRVRLREEKAKERDAAIDAFKTVLTDIGVNAFTGADPWTWRKVREVLEGDERVKHVDPLVQLEAFEDHARVIDKADSDAKDEERLTRLRAERTRRGAFVAMLRSMRSRHELPLRMPWRHFVKSIEDAPEFLEVSKNVSGSRPRELYDDVREEMESDAAADCAAVETAATAANVTIVPGETTIDALVQAVESTVSLPSLGSAEDDEVPGGDDSSSSKISRLRVACGDAIAGAVEAGARASRRKERALDDFYYLLRSRRRDVPITPRSTWREIEVALGSERAWIKCAGDTVTSDGKDDDGDEKSAPGDAKETYLEDARAVFDKYLAKLAKKEAKAREAMEDGEALDETVFDQVDEEDRSMDDRRRRRRSRDDEHSDEGGGGRDRKAARRR